MDWSDRHCCFFWRLMSRHARLYTEMVTTGALIHGDRAKLLAYSAQEHPLALQLGGSDAAELARCAYWAQEYGFDEVNLNCGCPSDRVQSGSFGACLMGRPAVVAEAVRAMRDACQLPVTVKHRLGIDHMEHYDELAAFVEAVAAAGCEIFIVHARKAWLQGLSPKENREIPPLRYTWVYRLKSDFPQLQVVLNGGIEDIEHARAHLEHVDGVMLGRAAYQNPWLLSRVDPELFGTAAPVEGSGDLIRRLLPYIEQQLAQGTPLNHMTRHILGLFNGQPGARRFRRHLSEHAHRAGAGIEVLEGALAQLGSLAA
jgi:tRNA-dihydrouridine synthase A